MRIAYLLIVAAVYFVMSGCAHSPQGQAAIPPPLVIDVRTEQEWQAGHLDGAILIPHNRIEKEIAAVAPDKRTRIYLYCRTGRRTGLAFEVLKKAGYEDLVNLKTLENASQELKLPIVK